MEAYPPFSTELLNQHADWIRRLAQTLVVDDSRVEDVVQQAWLSALESPPRDSRNLRAWWASVVRNVVRGQKRKDRSRLLREASVGPLASVPSTLETIEKLSMHREVVDAVLALDEPYRSTVLLRYVEERTPTQIAEAQAISVHTVHTRLQRGLERLRRRLDQRFDNDPSRWHCAFLPLATAGVSAADGASTVGWAAGRLTRFITGALVMSTEIKVAVGILALLGIVWVSQPWWSSVGAESSAITGVAEREADVAANPAEESMAVVDREREADRTVSSAVVEEHAAIESSGRIQGTVRLFVEEEQRDEASGSMELYVIDGIHRTQREIPVEAGRFVLSVSPTASLEVQALQLDGLRALPVQVQVPVEEGRANVTAAVPYRRTLEVVDALTQEPLEGVTLALPHRGHSVPWNLRADEVVLTKAASPIELVPSLLRRPDGPAVDWLARYYVWAPGYAWQAVQVNFQHEHGADRVELFTAGSLEVSVDSWVRLQSILDRTQGDLDAKLRIYDAPGIEEDYPAFEGPVGHGSYPVDGLRPGTYEVRLEIGEAYRDDRSTVAISRVKVEAGTVVECVLNVEELDSVPSKTVLAGDGVSSPGRRATDQASVATG